MNNKTYPWKQGAITGLVVGLFAIISFSVADALNKQFGWGLNPVNIRGVCGLLTLIILGVGIYTGMQSIKKQNDGILTYKQAISAGMLIGLLTGIITAALGFVYCAYINPGNAAYMVAESKKAMLAQGDTPAQIETQAAALQKQLTTASQVMQALAGQTICGAVISLIMGIFVRTKK